MDESALALSVKDNWQLGPGVTLFGIFTALICLFSQLVSYQYQTSFP